VVLVAIPGTAVGEPGDVSAAAPAITVSPAVGLVDLQSVTVTGSGFTPGAFLAVQQCKAGTIVLFPTCGFGGPFVTADGSGAFVTTMVVRRTIRTPVNLAYDCVASPGACEIDVIDSGPGGGGIASQSLTFDPSAPSPALPSLTVEPSADLVDGQVVNLDATGFVAGDNIVVIECTHTLGDGLHCANARFVPADATGSVHVAFTVRRIVHSNQTGAPFDCASVPGECALYAQSFADPVTTNWVPLEFDPSAPLPVDSLVASPITDLVDGQVVKLTGTLTGSASLALVQCGAGQVGNDASQCDQSTVRTAGVDAAGIVHGEAPARRVLRTPSGPIDCGEEVGRCQLLVGNLSTVSTIARFPLAYALDASVLVAPRFTG
jgi:hypothetical protein